MGPAPVEMGPAPVEIGPAPVEEPESWPGAKEPSGEAKNPKMSKIAKRTSISPPTQQPDRCAFFLPFSY
jgi:hypothetical protein